MSKPKACPICDNENWDGPNCGYERCEERNRERGRYGDE